MKHNDLICIGCPMGCNLSVTISDDGTIDVAGNTCPKGAQYATNEVTNPCRTVTSTIPLSNGQMLSVKTKEDIPKDKIMDCIAALKGIMVNTPTHIGDVILTNVANTGVDIVATKHCV